MTPYIYTRSGRRLNPLDPDPAAIDLHDLAHALALCNRFAGHTAEPVSVAQHSVYVARLAEGSWYAGKWDGPTYPAWPRTQLTIQALLHDASEAYLGDVTKWLKATPEFAPYRAAEDHVQGIIYRRFGVPIEVHPAVEWADRVMVRFEMGRGWPGDELARPGSLCPTRARDYPPLTPEELAAVGEWEFWDWRRAKMEFLQLYYQLEEQRTATLKTRVAATVARDPDALLEQLESNDLVD